MATESLVGLGFFVFVMLFVAVYDKHQRVHNHDTKKQDRRNHTR